MEERLGERAAAERTQRLEVAQDLADRIGGAGIGDEVEGFGARSEKDGGRTGEIA